MLKHLKGSKLKPRFSLGVWYFYPGGGRFHDAYVEKGTIADCIEKIKAMKDDGVIDGSSASRLTTPTRSIGTTSTSTRNWRRKRALSSSRASRCSSSIGSSSLVASATPTLRCDRWRRIASRRA